MKCLLILLLIISANSSAFEQTDYQCLTDCTGRGYQYNYCKSQCSYDSSKQFTQPQQQRPKQTDFQCLTDCTSKGYMYNFCSDRCSY